MGQVAHQHQRPIGRLQLRLGKDRVILRGQAFDFPHSKTRGKKLRQNLARLLCSQLIGVEDSENLNPLCGSSARHSRHFSSPKLTQGLPWILVFGFSLTVPDQIEIHKTKT